ncbi:MAG TPA: efflux RND transporter periplasmic adaptor subunit [Balneolaceae bacterium]|nr:efflux RND transporter periplasmic adaptor subunit [Balneolaceae bacterium]
MRRRKSFLIDIAFPAVTLFFLILSLASCSGSSGQNGNQQPNRDATIPAVEAVQARYGSLPLSERLSGTVIAKNQVELYPEISGKIDEVLVQNGQEVKKGDPLVRLQDNQYQQQVRQAEAGLRINNARLKQAKAQLNELQARYKRTKKLAEQNLSSDLEMETLEAQMESAQADVELAEAQVQQSQSNVKESQDVLSKTVIKAPVSGKVGQRNAEVGMQLNPSTRVFTIGDLNRLRVEVVLTEQMLQNIEVGQSVRIYAGQQSDNPTMISAKLSRISPFLNTTTRSTEAEIDVNNDNNLLRPGMFVPVDVLYGESDKATLVPTSALYTNPQTGEEGIYVATTLGMEVEPAKSVDPDNPPPLTDAIEVKFQPVNVLARGRMQLGISGINPGSWVVTVGQDLLSGGRGQARVRAVTWDRILALQGLQRQDLLRRVLKKQDDEQKNKAASQPSL